MGKRLTDQHITFAMEAASGISLTDAARRAGYKHPRVMGSRLAKEPHIAEFIEQLKAEARDRYQHSTDRLVTWLCSIVYGDISLLYDDQGRRLPIHRIPPHLRTLIDRGKPISIRDRLTAAKLLATITGANAPTKVELSGSIALSWEDVLAEGDE